MSHQGFANEETQKVWEAITAADGGRDMVAGMLRTVDTPEIAAGELRKSAYTAIEHALFNPKITAVEFLKSHLALLGLRRVHWSHPSWQSGFIAKRRADNNEDNLRYSTRR